MSSDNNHPGPPKFLEVLKFIWFFLWNGCETEWFIYAKTGGQALENAVISLLTFTTDDIVRAVFRPKGQRSWFHGGKPGKNMGKGKATNLIPEIAEMVGEGGRLAFDAEKFSYSSAGEVIWWIDSWTQQHLYYFMIANVIDEFAWDWYSGIIEAPSSNCALGRARIESPVEITNTGGWNSFVLDNVIYEHGGVIAHSTFMEFGPGRYFCSLMARVAKPPGPFFDADAQLGLIDDFNAFHFNGVSRRIRVDSTSFTDLIASGVFEGPGTAAFMQYTQGDHLLWHEVKAVCFQIDD